MEMEIPDENSKADLVPEANKKRKTMIAEDLDLVPEAKTLIYDGMQWEHDDKCKDALNREDNIWQNDVPIWDDPVVYETKCTTIIEPRSYLPSGYKPDHYDLFEAITNLKNESEKQGEIPLEKFLKDLGLVEFFEKLEAQKIGVTALKSFTCENLKALKLPVGARNTLRFALKNM